MNCKKATPPPHNASLQCDGIWVLFSPVTPSSGGFNLHSITVYSTHRSTEPFHPARVSTNDKRKRETGGGEEWPNVFVPGPNEASNSMNSLFDGSTPVSWWCVTWERLPLAGNHSASHHRLIFFPPFLLSFLSGHCVLIIFFSTTAGAHIQANEKWQLCTLFAIQHLPRPPVGPEEGELHSLTPTALVLFLPTRLYKSCLLCLVIKIKEACI